jgi:hypothetical protein
LLRHKKREVVLLLPYQQKRKYLFNSTELRENNCSPHTHAHKHDYKKAVKMYNNTSLAEDSIP